MPATEGSIGGALAIMLEADQIIADTPHPMPRTAEHRTIANTIIRLVMSQIQMSEMMPGRNRPENIGRTIEQSLRDSQSALRAERHAENVLAVARMESSSPGWQQDWTAMAKRAELDLHDLASAPSELAKAGRYSESAEANLSAVREFLDARLEKVRRSVESGSIDGLDALIDLQHIRDQTVSALASYATWVVHPRFEAHGIEQIARSGRHPNAEEPGGPVIAILASEMAEVIAEYTGVAAA